MMMMTEMTATDVTINRPLPRISLMVGKATIPILAVQFARPSHACTPGQRRTTVILAPFFDDGHLTVLRTKRFFAMMVVMVAMMVVMVAMMSRQLEPALFQLHRPRKKKRDRFARPSRSS